ncbi:unnamed protein product [Cochlearia groenlandica]
MGALVHVVSWIPEDDLLLKNAIEAGASLEALAKGVMHFSRRFSISELQDRWHALLYDPVVSAEAAFRMTEIELSNPSFPTKFARTGYSKDEKSSSRKRKAKNLRSAYHSLRKKFCTEPFNSLDLGFLVPPNDSHFVDNGDAPHFGFEDSDLDIINSAFPGLLGGGGCVTNHVVSEDNLQGDIGGENVTFTEHAGPSECDLAQEPKPTMASTDFFEQISTSLLGDFETFMEVGDKEVDKSYYDGFSSLLASLTNDTSRGDLPNCTEQVPFIAQTELVGTSAASSMECRSMSDSCALDPHPEIVGGVICCLLNQEEPDIPCNDDNFLSNNCLPMSVSSLARRNFKDTNNPTTSCFRNFSTSREKSEGYSLHSQKGRSKGSFQGKAEISQPSQGIKFKALTSPGSHDTVGPGVSAVSAKPCSSTLVSDGVGAKDGKKEMTGGRIIVGFDGHGSYIDKDSEKSKEENGVLPINEAPHAKYGDDGLREISDPQLEITQTEVDGHAFESDEDLPNYSDVEAMILDMDLDPDDQDNFDLEVSKYQSEDMKRTIVRLEQAANSYMQRAIASRGAFAVLYGRYSKHYIKKPEVLVGRSTNDLAVDIDLGREKRGSKISRRQAMIQLGNDGLFHIKNLGKYSISVNEKEVDPGQSLILKSDCLVEIRGMPFVFETNQSRIKEYLKRTEEKVS